MAHTTPEHNPFMLLVHPEAVFAAMEKSERLGRLNRHLCRPLDRPMGAQATLLAASEDEAEDETTEEVVQAQ
ncbi:MAG: hypothetical protein KIT17_12460 [Rubrivivax sp.]|nr:hypothetical protein [Rubrivivax sp.]